jgi:catechol 2,3-dioxygenase-like lactoylglutathione lyase family enzyme
MLRGIAHMAFVVEDMEKSLHFYCDILGFTKEFSLDDDNGKPWLNYLKVKDGQFIELFHGGNRRYPLQSDTAGFKHFCLEVDDIHEIAERLEMNGVPLDSKPSQGKDFNYQCWAKDPDGTSIEFMQMDPKSPQHNC